MKQKKERIFKEEVLDEYFNGCCHKALQKHTQDLKRSCEVEKAKALSQQREEIIDFCIFELVEEKDREEIKEEILLKLKYEQKLKLKEGKG